MITSRTASPAAIRYSAQVGGRSERPLEAALRALTWATVLLASALAVTRLY